MPAIERHALNEEAPARAALEDEYRGFRISIAASRRVTGAILVTTTLAGGPQQLRRFFCLHSLESEVHAACDSALAEVHHVIDDLLAL